MQISATLDVSGGQGITIALRHTPAQSIKIAQNEGIFICAGRMHINALREQVQFKVKLKPAYARHRSVV